MRRKPGRGPGAQLTARHRVHGWPGTGILSTAMHSRAQVIHLGALSSQLWQAARHLFEVVLAPLGLFYLLLTMTNLTGGLIAALAWALAALLRRVVTRTPIPAVLLLTTGLLVVRTVIGYATGSVFLYFLQPTLQNFLIAFGLLATMRLRRPLLARLADDFCAFPVALTSNLRVQRFFRRVSLLWALVFLTNGVATLWVLARATLGDFLMVTTAGSFTLVGIAAVVSLLWFRRELRGEGIRLRFGTATA
ncbi:MAG: VC0807 family protein [Pseudonocardiaceae bacterium]